MNLLRKSSRTRWIPDGIVPNSPSPRHPAGYASRSVCSGIALVCRPGITVTAQITPPINTVMEAAREITVTA